MALWMREGWFNQSPVDTSVVLTYMATWLNSFHIYVFTFISGYLFYHLKYERGKYKDLKLFANKRWNRIMIPYIFTAGLWCIPFHLYFFKPSATDLVNKYILAFSPSQLWFLVMLFVLSIGFYMVSDFVNYNKFIYMIALFLFIYFGSYIIGRFIPNIFQIITAMRYAIFYLLGFLFRKYKPTFLYKINYGLYLLTNIILLAVFMPISISDSMLFKIITILLQPCLNISGILMIVVGINKIGYIFNTENKMFHFLKKNNFTIYLLHQQVIYIVITLFNGIVNPYVLVILNFSIALIVSGMISVFLTKCNIILKKKNVS